MPTVQTDFVRLYSEMASGVIEACENNRESEESVRYITGFAFHN